MYLLVAVHDLHADSRGLRLPGPNGEPLGQRPIRLRHHHDRSAGQLLAVHRHGLVPVVRAHQRLNKTGRVKTRIKRNVKNRVGNRGEVRLFGVSESREKPTTRHKHNEHHLLATESHLRPLLSPDSREINEQALYTSFGAGTHFQESNHRYEYRRLPQDRSIQLRRTLHVRRFAVGAMGDEVARSGETCTLRAGLAGVRGLWSTPNDNGMHANMLVKHECTLPSVRSIHRPFYRSTTCCRPPLQNGLRNH